MPSHRYRKSRFASELKVVRQSDVGGALRSLRGADDTAEDGAEADGEDAAAVCAANAEGCRLEAESEVSDMEASLYPIGIGVQIGNGTRLLPL